jgi:hypothetical protein
MKTTVQRTSLIALGIALALAFALGTHGCGSSNDNTRERQRCDSCHPAQIESGCVRACLAFCAPDDAACADRCNVQCDRCKADLECHTCTSDCTGTVARCAPVDEPLTCEDGIF